MNVEILETYKRITPSENCILTEYVDGDDIKNYLSFKMCVCPLNCDCKHIREITLDKDLEYKQLKLQ